jgi:arylsulfatase A-like enzyme
MILFWPGADLANGRKFDAFHYQIDVSATILELLAVKVPDTWDGQSFAEALKRGEDTGREYLVLSQGAWTCQRGVRWDNYLLLQTLHDGYHCWDDVMLFDLDKDPHETNNIAAHAHDLRESGLKRLGAWHGEMMQAPARGRDPLQNVVKEGGPYHTRGRLKAYLARLRETGRSTYADALEEKFATEI